jgi:two-component system sensor histidine kinase KdpD
MADTPIARNYERRPSPKALLELAAKETRGKLKVFLGAAPGVGKTYAMLALAKAKKAEGVDVVVGVVETHGRADTAALLEGLEVLPRKTVGYRRRTLMEFDVEAAITRHPALLLVDEFAHTNAPDQLHPKRYQDVEEILRAGIDVWTTLNIQHLESLTDVVQRITGVVVRETIPDKVLDLADDIVIIDLPPAELIARLKEGKVYLPDNARRAVDQFFKPANLTALRELALRRTTDRVDEQMVEQLRQQGIEGAWPTAERLLVCVGGDNQSEKVVRAAARMAAALKSDWIALHVSASDHEITDKAVTRRIDKALRLAERLGGDSARLSGSDIAGEILRYAKRNNVTQIVVGRSSAGRIMRFLGRSLSHQLVATARDVSVTVVAPDGAAAQRLSWVWPQPSALFLPGATSTVVVGVAVLAGVAIEHVTLLPNLSMIFLFAVLACALRFGVWSALSAAVLSFLAYNFFFIDPRYTFTIASPHELFALLIFLVVAIVTGGLAGRLREQADATRDRAEGTQRLYDFSRKLAGAVNQEDVLWLLANQSAAAVRGASVILMHEGTDLTLVSGWPPEDTLGTSDWAAARWCFKTREPAGRSTTTLPTARFHYRPMTAGDTILAVIGVEPNDAKDDLPSDTAGALQSIIEQAAIAMERTRLVDVAAKVETAAESERLRSALLSSISHDLRTPLTSIVGSASSLRTLGERMAPNERAELLLTIEEEAGRLSSFVTNILEMTKLEAGAIELRHDRVDVAEVIRSAAIRANKVHAGRIIEFALVRSAPLVIEGDATLLEQVVFNLLDNAHKYSPPGTPTRVIATATGGNVRVVVEDQGVGIPEDELERVFDKFYRVRSGDGRASGTGLGLSICAALITAMGGSIAADSPITDGIGTRITLSLPAASAGVAA